MFIQDQLPNLYLWFCSSNLKATHLKTIYLQQIVWKPEWNIIVKQKGIENMNKQDWQEFCEDKSMCPHAAIILPKIYSFLHSPQIRRTKIKLFDGISIPTLPSILSNQEQIKQKLLGSFKVGDLDPAVSMDDEEFAVKINSGMIFIHLEILTIGKEEFIWGV